MTSSATKTVRPNEDLMLVLREVEGANKQDFGFEPAGPTTATLDNGEVVTFSHAWFDLIGDMHVRFVIDGENSMRNLTTDEFSAFCLTPEQAMEIAIGNIKKRYGNPQIEPWEGGIMLVAGDSPDLDSSYFLDRAFWNSLLKENPGGVVVGVPKRGGLIYTPVSNMKAVSSLESSIRYLYDSSENMRISSALYLYKAGIWTVYRKPASLN